MRHPTRRLYALGCGLGLLGSLVAVAGVALSYGVASSAGVGVVVAPFVFALSLKNTIERTDFDRDHSLGYRAVNVVGAVVTVVVGVSMLAIGLYTIGAVG